jgi:quinol monooxygenase YgiN
MVLVTIVTVNCKKNRRDEALAIARKWIEYSRENEKDVVDSFTVMLSETHPDVMVMCRRFRGMDSREQHNKSLGFKTALDEFYDERKDVVDSYHYSYYSEDPIGFPCRHSDNASDTSSSSSSSSRQSSCNS